MTALTKYTETRLIAMDKAANGHRPLTAFQAERYAQVKTEIIGEIATIVPALEGKVENNGLYYLWLVLGRVTADANENEKQILAQMRANMQTAHNQLKNWR